METLRKHAGFHLSSGASPAFCVFGPQSPAPTGTRAFDMLFSPPSLCSRVLLPFLTTVPPSYSPAGKHSDSHFPLCSVDPFAGGWVLAHWVCG